MIVLTDILACLGLSALFTIAVFIPALLLSIITSKKSNN